MTSTAYKNCEKIMQYMETNGYRIDSVVNANYVRALIQLYIGIDERTQTKYMKALCDFGFLKLMPSGTFHIHTMRAEQKLE